MIEFQYCTPSRNPIENMRIAEFAVSVIWDGALEEFGPHSSLGVYEDGTLIAGIIYHNWHPESGVMEMSGGSTTRRYLQPRVLRAIFEFPFTMCGAQMVVMRVSENSKPLVRMLMRFGFKGVLVPRLRGRDEAEWIMTLTDDDWQKTEIAKRGERMYSVTADAA